MYAFEYSAFNRTSDSEARRTGNITIVVVAATETEALAQAKSIPPDLPREFWELDTVTAISEITGMAVTTKGY